jgi:hypothetical protein
MANPLLIAGLGATALLLFSKKSTSGAPLQTPDGGTPRGTQESRRTAPPACPREFASDVERRTYLDKYNTWAMANGKPTQTYDQMFGGSTSSSDWYNSQAEKSPIQQAQQTMNDLASSAYNWAAGTFGIRNT